MKKLLLYIVTLFLTFTACKDSSKEDPIPVPIQPPRPSTTIEINEPGAVLETSVVFSGKVHQKDPSIKEYGIVYSKNPEVNIKAGTKVLIGPELDGSYRIRLKALEKETKYYVKAYLVHQDNVVIYSSNTYEFKTVKPGSWIKLTLPFQSINSSGFVINDLLYIIPGDIISSYTKRKLYTYDLELDLWTPKGEVPFSPRVYGNAFSYNGKGYFMLGATFDHTEKFDEVWEYDPTTQNWTKKASCPVKLSTASGFLLNGKYYVTSGYRGEDVFEYDILADTWARKGAIMDNVDINSRGNSFIYKGKGYLYSTSPWSGPSYNFAVYNPISNSWSYNSAPIPGYKWPNSRSSWRAYSVIINDKVYTELGDQSGDMYTYDMVTGEWVKVGAYPERSIAAETMVLNYNNKVFLMHMFGAYLYVPAQ